MRRLRTPLALSGSVLAAAAACTTQPTEDPVRSLERAERMATLCLQVRDEAPDGSSTPRSTPLPAPEEACNAVPERFDRNGEAFPFHLYALVTQTLRGELGVIDLTVAKATDTDRSSPGVNFIPVGESPTDVVSTPDGRWIVVASAAPSKPGLYAVPSTYILGDSRGAEFVPRVTDLIGCSLPAAPAGMAVVANGSDASSPYDIVVALPGDRLNPARLVAVSASAFTDPRLDDAANASASLPVGGFGACPLKYSVDAVVPSTLTPAATAQSWSDGITYRAGGALDADPAPLAPACSAATPPPAPSLANHLPARPARLGASVQDGTLLYVADLDNPIIHVFDLAQSPAVELPPLLAYSSADPTGSSSVRALAVSPTTRDLQRFLYAVEDATGSLLVFDVTDPNASYRQPLERPHAELNPAQPRDRVAFAAPVNAVTFVRADVPLSAGQDGSDRFASGVLCNPNANGGDLGALYTADREVASTPIGPNRLRGVFAMVALANGQVAVLDVDDWDAPCRRPANLSQPPDAVRASSISEPQPAVEGDAYGAPLLQRAAGTGDDGSAIAAFDASAKVTGEAFFPVSAPHRLRSKYLLRNVSGDTGGDRIPRPTGTPTLSRGNTPLDVSGDAAAANPLLQPTAPDYADPSGSASIASEGFTPAVRMSFELPDVHLDQDWSIAFEGVLPGLDGVRGELSTRDDFQSLTLGAREINFCAFGVEDRTLGQQRAAAFNAALQSEAELPPDEQLASRVSDYVQITDELLPIQDPYWMLDDNECWAPFDEAASLTENNPAARGAARYRACFEAFGRADDALVSRDFPILEASRGEMRLGRYYYPEGGENDVRQREIVGAQASNRGVLAAAMCCFHNRVSLRVRTGGSWLASGSVSGHLHHVVAGDDDRCVQSCEPQRSVQNGRVLSAPRELQDKNLQPARNSALAMRNPMLSFYLLDGRNAAGRVRPDRDYTWRFSTRNQFTSLALDTASQSTNTNPRALRFIAPLGQVAVLDGAAQGLSLIDLRSMTFVGTPVY